MTEKQINKQLMESDSGNLRFDRFKPSPKEKGAIRRQFRLVGIPLKRLY